MPDNIPSYIKYGLFKSFVHYKHKKLTSKQVMMTKIRQCGVCGLILHNDGACPVVRRSKSKYIERIKSQNHSKTKEKKPSNSFKLAI